VASDGDATPGPFAEAFDAALRASPHNVEELRARLVRRGHRVASSTLGYWRRGHRRPERTNSLEIVAEIEAILGLAPGTLLDTIGATRRPGPPVARVDVGALPAMAPAIKEALAAVGMAEPLPGHIEESVDVVADIGADQQWQRMTTRARLRAKADDVGRTTAYCVADPQMSAVQVAVSGGARLGRRVCWPEHGLLVAELILDRALSIGETAIVEYSFGFEPSVTPDCEFGSYATNRLAEISVWARFADGAAPRQGWRFQQAVGEPEDLTPVDLDGAGSLHHALNGFGPGLMGVRWEW
jgi:hypothetical protein